MTYVRSFDDASPPARFDGLPYTNALVREAPDVSGAPGAFSLIDTLALSPVDTDPTRPQLRDLTTTLATLPIGWYRLDWRDASGAIFQGEAVPYPGNDPRDLCTLGDVRARRQTTNAQTHQDDEVSWLITAVSAAIGEHVEREFTPTAGATRTFEYDPQEGDEISLTPYDLRTLSQLRLSPDTAEPTDLDVDDYRLAPYPSKHGTFTAVRLRPSVVIPNATWGTTLVEITGDWGFIEVPPNVREAAIVSVVHNMRTTVGQYSHADGAGGETRYERVEIPQAAKDLLAPFQRMS